MKFKDLTFNNKNIFTYLEEIKAFPFSSEVTSSIEMFHAFVFLNGEREVFNKIEEEFKLESEITLKQLAMNLKLMNAKKWELQCNLMTLDLYSTSLESVRELVINNGNNVNNVSSFDSEELVTDSNESKSNEFNREYQRSTKSIQQSIKNVTMLQDRLIYDIIFKDIRESILKNII